MGVIFSNYKIRTSEEYSGPEPGKFDPERFSPEAIAARKGTRAEFLDHPVVCKPFGYGARMCVGSRVARLEYTSLITRILQDFNININTDDVTKAERVTGVTTTLKPMPRMSFTPRKF